MSMVKPSNRTRKKSCPILPGFTGPPGGIIHEDSASPPSTAAGDESQTGGMPPRHYKLPSYSPLHKVRRSSVPSIPSRGLIRSEEEETDSEAEIHISRRSGSRSGDAKLRSRCSGEALLPSRPSLESLTSSPVVRMTISSDSDDAAEEAVAAPRHRRGRRSSLPDARLNAVNQSNAARKHSFAGGPSDRRMSRLSDISEKTSNSCVSPPQRLSMDINAQMQDSESEGDIDSEEDEMRMLAVRGGGRPRASLPAHLLPRPDSWADRSERNPSREIPDEHGPGAGTLFPSRSSPRMSIADDDMEGPGSPCSPCTPVTPEIRGEVVFPRSREEGEAPSTKDNTNRRPSFSNKLKEKFANLFKRRGSLPSDTAPKKQSKKKKKDKNMKKAFSDILGRRRTTRKGRKSEGKPTTGLVIDAFMEDFAYLWPTIPRESIGEDLRRMDNLIRFPEEVALHLISAEFDLFMRAAPRAYLQFTEELIRSSTSSSLALEEILKDCPIAQLARRFAEVKTWTRELIINADPVTLERRMAVLSCLIRVAQFCFDNGAMSVAVQILVGLKSKELLPFWQTIKDRGQEVKSFNRLCEELLKMEPSEESTTRLAKCLQVPGCKVIPFYGYVIEEIKAIKTETKDCQREVHQLLEVTEEINAYLKQIRRLPISSDDDDARPSLDCLELPKHAITFLPEDADLHPADIFMMQQGVTVLTFNISGTSLGSKCLRLEGDGRTLAWYDPDWSKLLSGEAAPKDYKFRGTPLLESSALLQERYKSNCDFLDGYYVDLSIVKEVKCTGYPGDYPYHEGARQFEIDSTTDQREPVVNFITLVHGDPPNIRETRILVPVDMWRVWSKNLAKIVNCFRNNNDVKSKTIKWVKEQYIREFYKEDPCRALSPLDAITLFGGQVPNSLGAQLETFAGNVDITVPEMEILEKEHCTFDDFMDLYINMIVHMRKDIKDISSAYDAHHESTGTTVTGASRLLSPDLCPLLSFLCVKDNSTGIKQQSISVKRLQEFLKEKQGEKQPEYYSQQIIQRYEPNDELKHRGLLSLSGFVQYLLGDECDILDKTKEVMTFPLSHYYINSSHNTYLTAHQLVGESSVHMYTEALLAGYRCIELDCWNGENEEPIIYHGLTFVTKISFKDVIVAINRNAFTVSPYPLILSLENHCSYDQQRIMAQVMKKEFGDKLLQEILPGPAANLELPSPDDLMYKIIIKNRKNTRQGSMKKGERKLSLAPSGKSIDSGSYGNDSDEEIQDEEDEQVNIPEDMLTRHGRPSSDKSSPSAKQVKDVTRSKSDAESKSPEDAKSQKGRIKFRRKSSASVADSTGIGETPTGSFTSVTSLSSLKGRKLSVGSIISPIINRKSKTRLSDKSSDGSDTDISTLLKTQRSLSVANLTEDSRRTRSTHRSKKEKVPPELEELVIYGEATRFRESWLKPAVDTHKHSDDKNSQSLYQLPSFDEHVAKRLAHKFTTRLVYHTTTYWLRVFPKGTRIDSSNYSPIDSWASGIQMVALNLQTKDMPMLLNRALFEAGEGCGYVLKPEVMIDKNHPQYGIFNPFLSTELKMTLEVEIISGQFLNLQNLQSTVWVTLDIIGVPADVTAQPKRTDDVRENALNPIWKQYFKFIINFPDLAFLRLCVHTHTGQHNTAIISQRIIPIAKMKEGLRHVRMRSPADKDLPLSTLFVNCRKKGHRRSRKGRLQPHSPQPSPKVTSKRRQSLPVLTAQPTSPSLVPKLAQRHRSPSLLPSLPTQPSGGGKRSISPREANFIVNLHNVSFDEGKITLMFAPESITASELLQKAFDAENRGDNIDDYELVEEATILTEDQEDTSVKERNVRALGKQESVHKAWLSWQGRENEECRFFVAKIGATYQGLVIDC